MSDNQKGFDESVTFCNVQKLEAEVESLGNSEQKQWFLSIPSSSEMLLWYTRLNCFLHKWLLCLKGVQRYAH